LSSDYLVKFLRAGRHRKTGPVRAGEKALSEAQNESKGEKKPDLEPFLGLVEHISRSMDLAFSATAGLPDQIYSEIETADGIDAQKRIDIAHEVGRLRQSLWLLHKLLLSDLANNFFDNPKNVKRYMIIMSYLAKAFLDFKDRKVDIVATLEGALEEARNNLEDYIMDVINAIISGDDPDDYDDDDYSDDDSS